MKLREGYVLHVSVHGEGGRGGVPYPRYQTPPPPEPQKRAVSIPLECLLVCYRPQMKLRKGNVFTSVCQEFYPQGACTPPWAGTPLADPPSQQTASAADGTHLTGMHSCFVLFCFLTISLFRSKTTCSLTLLGIHYIISVFIL